MKENKEQIQVKREIALKHRRDGLSYRKIGEKMGLPTSKVYSYVQDAIKIIQKKYTEKAKALVTLERHKLDRLEVGLVKDIKNGDVKAVIAMLKIMERRAKLLGLDEPAKSEVKVEAVDVTIKTPEGL